MIPAYNEEDYIAACLQAALGQAEPFYEIIVVDNNSTDNTAKIARSFHGVIVISEPQQGVVFARGAGFDAARGDIIGRIDVDTLLSPSWSSQIMNTFTDTTLAAVSGRPVYYDVALPKFFTAVENFFRRTMVRELQDILFLQGANMAIKKSSWHQIKQHVCLRQNMHEDFDLAIHLQEYGHSVIYDDNLVAGLSARRIDVGFLSFMRYAGMSPHTYALHEVREGRRMYPVMVVTAIGWLPGRILYRGYNPVTDSFSFLRVFKRRKYLERPDPTRT